MNFFFFSILPVFLELRDSLVLFRIKDLSLLLLSRMADLKIVSLYL